MKEFDYGKVKNPEVYAEGCNSPHSDHRYYRTLEEMQEGEESFCHCLNGWWKFHYGESFDRTIKGFEQPEVSCKHWESIRVPSHIQLEGYDKIGYVNIQYPW